MDFYVGPVNENAGICICILFGVQVSAAPTTIASLLVSCCVVSAARVRVPIAS